MVTSAYLFTSLVTICSLFELLQEVAIRHMLLAIPKVSVLLLTTTTVIFCDLP